VASSNPAKTRTTFIRRRHVRIVTLKRPHEPLWSLGSRLVPKSRRPLGTTHRVPDRPSVRQRPTLRR
jgi:hypothetical protein